MANVVVVGAQWGDEGKGKIVDWLSVGADVVVRFQGGHNAGHTLVIDGKTYKLALLPSGIVRPGKLSIIGNGVVLDPYHLIDEIEKLRGQGVEVTPANLKVAENVPLILSLHRELDAHRESGNAGGAKIGTTKRGIGPAYGDKAARTGLRVIDLINPERFKRLLQAKIKENNEILRAFGAKPLSFKAVHAAYRAAGDFLKPFVANTVILLHQAVQRGQDILFEGAQGTFLDIDHGTYPFVTSSNTTAGGACTGSGIPPHRIDRVVGVMKAYTTRVGEGPLPTENAEIADMLHAMGREFGATTGRPRRCGWFDAVAAHHACMVNGIDDLAITNLDGLDSVGTIKVCIAYRDGSTRYDYVPNDIEVLGRCEPVFAEFAGWQTSTSDARHWKELPAKARSYLKALAGLTGASLAIASVGPGREQTICL